MAFFQGMRAAKMLMLLVFGTFAVCGLAYYKIDEVLNYTHVNATFDGLEDLCRRVGGGDTWVPCWNIPQQIRNGRETRASFRFVSPADKREHSVVVLISPNKRDELIRVLPGTIIEILAHDDKPEVVRLD